MARRLKKFSQAYLDAFAVRLRSLINEGESANAFGRRVGVSSGTMSEYLKGNKVPTFETIMSIASSVGVSLDWLATGKKENDKTASSSTSLLAEDEALLLDDFRVLSEKDKQEIRLAARARKRKVA